MYAIFETGGKQYKVSAGDVIKIEKIEGKEGDKVKLGNVIAFSDGKDALQTGTPYLEAATVNATITKSGKGEKIIVFKFKAKKDYRNKKGHRQPFTEIEIDNFTIGGKSLGEKPKKKEPEVKEEKAEEAVKTEDQKAKKPAKEKAEKAEAKEATAEAPVKEPEPKAEKAPKADKPKEAKAEPKAEKPVKDEAKKAEPKAEKPKKEAAPKAASADEAKSASKMTKTDIMEKLDELGIEYVKSAKKDELLALLDGAEKK